MYLLSTPYWQQEGGDSRVDIFIAFTISVMAGIVCHYICKWLDGNDSDN